MTTTASPAPSIPGRLRALYDAAGAHWLDLPVLHPADPFLETAGEDIRRRMFVTEGRSGDRLALRPDFTIPVCLHHLAKGGGAERYAYEGVVFRRSATGPAERLETGYEDIGRPDRMAADAEAIALAVRGVSALGAGPATAELGDIGLFVALLMALGLPEPWRRRLRRSFGLPAHMTANLDRLAEGRGSAVEPLEPALAAAAGAHDREALIAALEERMAQAGHAPDAGRTAAEIADRFLDRQALSETQLAPQALRTLRDFLGLRSDLRSASAMIERFAAQQHLDLGEALVLFATRCAALADLAPPADMTFAAGFGRPLDYYTGLVFEVRTELFPYPLAGGGRYDRLMTMLGAKEPTPAVGFTIRLDGQPGRVPS